MSDSEPKKEVIEIQTWELPETCLTIYLIGKLVPVRNKIIANVSSNIMASIMSNIPPFVFSHEM